MIELPEITVERVQYAFGNGEPLPELARKAVDGIGGGFTGVIAATFSNPSRFPPLSVEIASYLGLDESVAAFDVQMACSAYPYAVYLAGKIAADTGGKVLVVDGDVQSPLVDASDHATAGIFSDGCTASVISVDGTGVSRFAFRSRYDEALVCPAAGPVKMDGFKVFSFVATEVSAFLRVFGDDFDHFVPHQANAYMVRQLAKTLGLSDKLAVLPPEFKNPGSCSIPMTIAMGSDPVDEKKPLRGRALIAGFGAGYSAAAGIVRIK